MPSRCLNDPLINETTTVQLISQPEMALSGHGKFMPLLSAVIRPLFNSLVLYNSPYNVEITSTLEGKLFNCQSSCHFLYQALSKDILSLHQIGALTIGTSGLSLQGLTEAIYGRGRLDTVLVSFESAVDTFRFPHISTLGTLAEVTYFVNYRDV